MMRADEWELDRILDDRCPKCGSDQTNYGVTVWDSEVGDVAYVGVRCSDCEYWHDGDSVMTDTVFIAPGKPGSHDRAAYYDESEG